MDRIEIWQGDIVELAVDAIVNAANSSLLGGGGSMARSTARRGPIYGYPIDLAAAVAARAIVGFVATSPRPERIVLCTSTRAPARRVRVAELRDHPIDLR